MKCDRSAMPTPRETHFKRLTEVARTSLCSECLGAERKGPRRCRVTRAHFKLGRSPLSRVTARRDASRPRQTSWLRRANWGEATEASHWGSGGGGHARRHSPRRRQLCVRALTRDWTAGDHLASLTLLLLTLLSAVTVSYNSHAKLLFYVHKILDCWTDETSCTLLKSF